MWKRWIQKWRSKEELPAFWLAYETAIREGFHRRTLIEELDFVVFDTETTGLDVKSDRILSIGTVRVRAWQIDLRDTFECLIHQENHPKNSSSIPVHGILPVYRPESWSEKKAIEAFINYLGASILVGHHVAFDIAMINRILKEMGAKKLQNKCLDTGRLAGRLENAYYQAFEKTLSLDALCEQFNIVPNDRHTAAGDAYLTALLFMKLLAKLKKRGVKNLGDLLR